MIDLTLNSSKKKGMTVILVKFIIHFYFKKINHASKNGNNHDNENFGSSFWRVAC